MGAVDGGGRGAHRPALPAPGRHDGRLPAGLSRDRGAQIEAGRVQAPIRRRIGCVVRGRLAPPTYAVCGPSPNPTSATSRWSRNISTCSLSVAPVDLIRDHIVRSHGPDLHSCRGAFDVSPTAQFHDRWHPTRPGRRPPTCTPDGPGDLFPRLLEGGWAALEHCHPRSNLRSPAGGASLDPSWRDRASSIRIASSEFRNRPWWRPKNRRAAVARRAAAALSRQRSPHSPPARPSRRERPPRSAPRPPAHRHRRSSGRSRRTRGAPGPLSARRHRRPIPSPPPRRRTATSTRRCSPIRPAK